MRFDILTLFPEFFSSILNHSITGRAIEKGILNFNYINIRDYADDKHNRVDDYPFGGGLGMLLKPQPVFNAYNSILRSSDKRPTTIYMSPRGKVFNQKIATELAQKEHIVILCGHYEGIDQRVIDEICDYELSIGDFVLTGGEIAAITVCDAVSRLVPGVLSETESFENESHYNGLLEFSQYTRPRTFNGIDVPDVLISGNQSNIDKWKYENSVEITKINRPDLYEIEFNAKCDEKEKYNVSVLLLGDEHYCNNKVLSALDMQLKKRNIYIKDVFFNKVPENVENMIVIVCSDQNFEFEKIKNTENSLIFGLRETDTIALNDQHINIDNITKTFLNTFSFKTISEIAAEIKSFVISVEIAKKLKNGDLVSDIYKDECQSIDLLKPVPYDAYENNLSKFKKYSIKDLFIFDCKSKVTDEYRTLIIGKKAYNAEFYKIKTKELGTKYALAINEFEDIYVNNPNSECYICKGDISEIFNTAIKLI